jgi:hypothetical protein
VEAIKFLQPEPGIKKKTEEEFALTHFKNE